MAILEAEFVPEPTPEDTGELPYGQIPAGPPSQAERHLRLVNEAEEPQPEEVAVEGIVQTMANVRERRALQDLQLVLAAQKGDVTAMNTMVRRYKPYVKNKATAYFIAGAENDDVVQEGLIGLYKAVRDFDPAKGVAFRSFADLCITRQIVTAVKTATRFKRMPLNNYVSFSHTPASQEGEDITLGDIFPGPAVNDPSVRVISTEELQALVTMLSTNLSPLESNALQMYMEGYSYDQMAEELGCDFKSIDNALQRVRRKVLVMQESRAVLQ